MGLSIWFDCEFAKHLSKKKIEILDKLTLCGYHSLIPKPEKDIV